MPGAAQGRSAQLAHMTWPSNSWIWEWEEKHAGFRRLVGLEME
jgi:hypothetical protein